MKGLIFTWLLTFFGVSGSLFRPYYGFLAYVALAILKPGFLWKYSVGEGRQSLMVAAAMLASWGLRGCGNWNLGKSRIIVMCFVLFWLWTVLLSLVAESPPHAWTFVEAMAKILLPFIVGITSCRDIKDLKALAWVLVLTQGYICFELNVYYFSGYNFLYFIGYGGMDNNAAAIGIVTILGVAFFLFLNTEKYWHKAIIAGCGAFMLHSILFSFSRGAMLSTIIGVTISFFLIKKKPSHYLLFALGVSAAAVLAGPEVRARFGRIFETTKSGQREASAQSRLDLWADCYTVFVEKPIFGCGPDHWPLYAKRMGWVEVGEAHNLWVQTAVETGTPGITLFLLFYLSCIWRCWRLLKELPDDAPPWYGDSCRMTIAALCGFGVASQFVTIEALEHPYYVVLLGAGTVLLYNRSKDEQAHDDDREQEMISVSNDSSDWRSQVDQQPMLAEPGPVIMN
ncbi:MAG: O-antigen ligase family protein [Fuerstiella sp.]